MKSTRTRFVIGSLLLLLGWTLLALAEFNASYKLEISAAPMGSGAAPTWVAFFQANGVEFLQYLFPKRDHIPLVLLFFFPALTILLPFRNFALGKVTVMGTIVLAFIDLAVLVVFDGGDSNGCEVCFVGAGAHLLFSMVLFFIAFAALISTVMRGHRA